MKDRYNRNINYIRISITDRCNLRCRYCMPDGISCVSHEEILRYEEILQICRAAVSVGITNFKVTGGEPLVRKGCLDFIRELKALEGVDTVTLTTNGVRLKQAVPVLKEIGIDAVNVSLDTTDPKEYRTLTGFDCYQDVLEGIMACYQTGICTKLNCVLLKGEEEQVRRLAKIAENYEIDVRFIELMPIGYGSTCGGMTREEAEKLLKEVYPDLGKERLAESREKIQHRAGNGPAVYETSKLLKGRIGWIDAVSHQFCSSCNRLRLTSTGLLKPCLCYGEGTELKPILRDSGQKEAERERLLAEAIRDAISHKPMQHCFADKTGISEKNKMSQIGG